MQDRKLTRIDAVTSAYTIINAQVGDGVQTINGIGFNIADGFLYGIYGAFPSRLLQISTATGASTDLGSLNLTQTFNTGVVDENSQFWILSSTSTAWAQIDLRLGSSTFGKTVATGTSTAPVRVVLDWAWVPGTNGDNSLWGLGYDATSLITYLLKWNRSTKVWTTAYSYLNVRGALAGSTAVWASVFASQDGYLFGVDNGSGDVYRFSLPNVTGISLNLFGTYITTTAPATVADGARCVTA